MKRTMKILIVALAILLLWAFPEKMTAEVTEFYGQKEIVYKISHSDIRNFCNGGQKGLEKALKECLPEGVTYRIEEEEYAITLTFVIPFDTYQTYVKRNQAIWGEDIIISWQAGDEMLLGENFCSKDAQNFLVDPLKEAGVCTEVDFSYITKYMGAKLILNGQEYSIEDKTCIMEECPVEEEFLFKNLYIDILESEAGYEAEVLVQIENVGDDFWQQYEKTLAEYIESIEGSKTKTLKLTAPTLEELFHKLRMCLGIYIGREKSYVLHEDGSLRAKERIAVLYAEKEDWVFYYNFKMDIGRFYKNPSRENSDTSISEGKVINSRTEIIEYSYDAEVAFQEIGITTHYTDGWGKYTRELVFKLPKVYVNAVGEKVAEEIKENLSDGMSCHIYDEGDVRYYKISITTSDIEEIEDFTSAYLGGRCKFEVIPAFLGFGEDAVQEVYRTKDMVLGVAPPTEMNVRYVSSKGETLLEKADITKERVKYNYSVKQFKMQNVLQLIIVFVGIITVISYVLLGVKMVQVFKNKKQEITREE